METLMIELVIDGRKKDLGGFTVARILPYPSRRMVGPFIFFDHMGPVTFPADPPRSADVRPHPHIGLSTVTYLYEGEIRHRDSLGVEQPIRPGEVNWMTAGRGISHSERFDGPIRAHGGVLHGIQAWVALPQEQEESEPDFAHYDSDALPTYEYQGLAARLIAGEAFGATNAVKTRSPLFYVHSEMKPGAVTGLPDGYSERAAYVARGRVEIDGREFTTDQMILFSPQARPTIRAVEDSTVMLLGGEPVGPRHIWWNFVSSSRDRIEQAKADWKAGRIPLPPEDNAEFIPLPEDPPPPVHPLS
jgi:redox-sensitive bicupin YhaK (pirin superfamily)